VNGRAAILQESADGGFLFAKKEQNELIKDSKRGERCTNAFYYFFTFDSFGYGVSFVRNFSGSRNRWFVIKYRGGYVFY